MSNPGRLIWRAIGLGVTLGLIVLRFSWLTLSTWGRPTTRQRAVALQWGARQVRDFFLSEVTLRGPRPTSGMLVSNHLSYLDIALLGSLSPAVFVSKAEVRRWPLFGWFAAMGGTVFVRRERRGEVGLIGQLMGRLLAEGELVVLFPEGTSSGGESVLPFKSSLLEPIVNQPHALHVACIAYDLPGGLASQDVCYWGDMSFGPHVLNLLQRPKARARVAFADVAQPAPDRKELARQLWTTASALHQQVSPPASPSRAEILFE